MAAAFSQRSPIEYPLSITNPSSSLERYQFTLGEFGEYASFDENPLLVGAGQTKIVTLSLDVPCSFSGSKNITMHITSQISGGSSDIIIPVSLLSCSPLEAQFGRNFLIGEEKETTFTEHKGAYSICENSKEAVPVFLTQLWNEKTDYRLLLEGESWASLAGSKISLRPGQKGLVYIRLEPLMDKEGNYSFALKSRYGKEEHSFPFDVTVRNCYGVSADVPKKITFCGCEPKAFDVNITNIGEAKEKISLLLKGEPWATLEPGEMTLGAKASDAAFLKLEPPCEEDRDYSFGIEASTINIDVKNTFPFEAHVLTEESCLNTELVAEEAHEIDYEPFLIPVVVSNAGGKAMAYKLSLQGAPWVSLSDKVLTLGAGENKTITLESAPSQSIPPGKYFFALSAQTGNKTFEKKMVLDLAKKTAPRGFAGWLWWNRYYVYTGIAILAVLTALIFLGVYGIRQLKKSRKRAMQRLMRRKTYSKKNIAALTKTKKRTERGYIFFLTLVIAMVIIFLADAYSLFERAKDFFVVYSNFIYMGIALAVILVLFLKYYKPVIDFLKAKDDKKGK